MKRIVASIGAAAIGSTALHQAQAVNLSPQESTKPWSVSVGLRGFYDDNYLMEPRDSPDIPSSYGIEIRPNIGINLPLEQTYIGMDFTYIGEWYEDRSNDPWDNSFLLNGLVNHSFTERVTLEVKDNFVYSQRPELTDPTLSTTIRTDQNNLNNRGNIQLSVGLSRRLGLVVGYQNVFWNYQDDNPLSETVPPGTIGVNPNPPPALVANTASASLSARLDRIQNLIPVNLRYQLAPATVGFVGYSFGTVDYTSDEYLYFSPAVGAQRADSRNYNSHYGYVGVEHVFSPLLSVSGKAGAQYSDFYNSPTDESTVTPYGDISLTYFYTTGSQLEVGYTLSQESTDQVTPDNSGTPTLNRTVSSLFARVDHQFLPQLHGRLYGQWGYSQYYGGAYDRESENLYLFGASVYYQFTPFLAADLGYTFDYLDSDVPSRGYTRNRVHIGLNASY